MICIVLLKALLNLIGEYYTKKLRKEFILTVIMENIVLSYKISYDYWVSITHSGLELIN